MPENSPKYSGYSLVKRGKRWQGQLQYKGDDGKWHRKTRMMKASGKREAGQELDKWRLEMEAKAEAGEDEAAHTKTVEEVMTAYIDANAIAVVPTTTTSYKTLAKNMVYPFIGGVEIGQLDSEAVQEWVLSLQASPAPTTGKPYHPNTIRKAYRLLKAVMKQEVERGHIDRDPTETVKLPKKVTQKPNALTELEQGKVINFCDINPTSPVSMGIRIALFAGMREGEICALRWKNVNLDAGTIDVKEALGHASKSDVEQYTDTPTCYSGYYLKTPKSESSTRTIDIGASLCDALGKRRSAMIKECLAASVPFKESLFVVGTIDGNPMNPHHLWERWNSIATDLELSGTRDKTPTFHDLRHTYATTAIHNGIDVKTVSANMGHKSAAMTLDIYTSDDKPSSKRAADRLDDVYRQSQAVASRTESGDVLVEVDVPATGTDGMPQSL